MLSGLYEEILFTFSMHSNVGMCLSSSKQTIYEKIRGKTGLWTKADINSL